MDHLTFAQLLGNYGEFVGALAVVVTLIYLARQIRQNSASLDRANDYAQANSVHAMNSLYVQVFAPLSQNAELASTYKKALDGSKLEPVEAIRFGAFVNTFFAVLETLYFQHRHDLGFVGETLETWEQATGPYVRSLLDADAGLSWWRTEGQNLYSQEFAASIERARVAPD